MKKNAVKQFFTLWMLIAWIWGTGCRDVMDDSMYIDPTDNVDPVSAQSDLVRLANGLGYQIPCVAPVREEYIAQMGGNPETKEGDIASLQHTILFLFDKSGSMSSDWGDVSKWSAAAEAMTFSVELYSHYVSAGTVFFPTGGSCEVDAITAPSQIYFTDGDNFSSQWEASMQQKQADGSTPMLAAFERADEALAIACATGMMTRPLKVVLIADGKPTCNHDDDEADVMVRYAQKWLAHGVMTFVIGLPGSEKASDLLEQIAAAGGSTQHIIEKREQEVSVETVDSDHPILIDQTDTDSTGGAGSDNPTSVDTSGVIAPEDQNTLEESIAICVE